MTGLSARAEALRALHHGVRPLVLPTAWDVASAHLVAEAGFHAVATSSGAIADALGYEDDDSMPPDEAFGAVARIAGAVDLPVTADLEAGYGLAPGAFAARLLDAGAVGCNLEDSDHHGDGALVDASEQAARIAAIKEAAREAGTDIVLNARIDVFIQHPNDPPNTHLDEAIRRARAYIAAGADCVYPILLGVRDSIAEFVDAVEHHPVNIYLSSKRSSIAELAELGVARISMGSGLMHIAYRAAAAELERLRASY
jgi:2-methylisocitrate lyase-like PEP mutase family enzyme